MIALSHTADITIFVGRFGSGKTEASINYALALAQQATENSSQPASSPERPATEAERGDTNPVILIDLDIVTPYFRSRETAEAMRQRRVDVISPSAIGQHLDTPAITPQILGAIQQAQRPVVLDVGGDRQGARALGQFSSAIRQRGYTMYFVVNPYRPFTDSLSGVTSSISEIEASARLRVTNLISNPNLMTETSREQILEGHAKIERYAEKLRLPVAFVCLEQSWATKLENILFAQPVLYLERFFVMTWE